MVLLLCMVDADVIRIKHECIDMTGVRLPLFGFGLRPCRTSIDIALSELEVIYGCRRANTVSSLFYVLGVWPLSATP